MWELFEMYALGDSAQTIGRTASANLLGQTFLFLQYFLSETGKLTDHLRWAVLATRKLNSN